MLAVVVEETEDNGLLLPLPLIERRWRGGAAGAAPLIRVDSPSPCGSSRGSRWPTDGGSHDGVREKADMQRETEKKKAPGN